ncbi:MAG: XrtA system polysaccharide deacetylase [Gemmataceae bacterium]
MTIPYILSFDIEEHHRIEAAFGLSVPPATQAEYAQRMDRSTRQILELLAKHQALASFYIVGEIAKSHPELVKAIAAAGHEIGSHSWDHQRVHRFTPATFREDLRHSRAVLEEVSGQPVVGFRAPTFSILRSTAWAIDALFETGYEYDSSIFPVRHDRYGVPDAPRQPFLVRGEEHQLLELPPATWRLGGQNLPVAGGGYFRLFPAPIMRKGLRELARQVPSAVGMMYFHPWEFDEDQPRLPLKRLSRFRTYVGIRHSFRRLEALLQQFGSQRAIDVVQRIDRTQCPEFTLASSSDAVATSNPRP